MIIDTRIKSIMDYDDAWYEETFDILPSWRREKAASFKNENARKASILGGKMIMDAFLENGEDPENVCFNEAGKPMIKGDTFLFFSLSHSKDAVALSVSTPNDNNPVLPGNGRIDTSKVFSAVLLGPRTASNPSPDASTPSIGIDIEYIRTYDEKLVERFFSKEEQDYLRFTDEKDENFTRIWTSKEAYGKFTGGGITDGLKFSIFHNPVMPLNDLLPCCFEHGETMVNGEKYIYTLCYGSL